MRYERAAWRPIATNFRRGRSRGAAKVQAFVCHSQEGYGSLHALFNNPARRASTHFWIGKDGAVEQYVDTDDTAWGNGERNRAGGPDPRVPWAAAAYTDASLNDETVSCELEGRAGEAISPEQEAAARELIRWVHESHNLGQPRRDVTVVEHNQLSATACPSGRWPINRLVTPLPRPPANPSPCTERGLGGEVEEVLAFWYPGSSSEAALAHFINQTIVNDLRGAA